MPPAPILHPGSSCCLFLLPQTLTQTYLHTGEDKLIAFQKTVNGAIKETEAVLQAMQKAMGGCATAPDLIPFIRLIKPIKAGLGL